MTFKQGVLILECIPESEKRHEGILLHEFLKLFFTKKSKLVYIRTKKEFFSELKKNNYRYIHISCHGSNNKKGEYYIRLPYGRIYTKEFNEKSGLKNRVCFLSACKLGSEKFAEPFIENTGLNILIASKEKIYFIDSALFWIKLYYNRFYLNESVQSSFFKAKSVLTRSSFLKFYYKTGFWNY